MAKVLFFTSASSGLIGGMAPFLQEDQMAIEMKGLTPLLQVFDMPTSIRFYRDVLGFEVIQTSRPGEVFDWAWLRRDAAELMLNTAYGQEHRPPAPDRARAAGHDDTCLFISCPDVDGAYAHLREKGP
jgi:catechol 2,3-dioxygenase-like lactoylglutathione lyase family enzyme